MTSHISANKGDIASVVLVAGDPLRVKYIAENFLDDIKLVSSVRGIYAYTGKYKGKEISVMAHGMGIPSMGIYAHELFSFYDVDCIIRIGTCGSYTKDLNLKDIIVVDNIYSESTFSELYNGKKDHIISCNNSCNDIVFKTAKNMKLNITKGTIHCSDVFYSSTVKPEDLYEKYGCVGVEMESFALFTVANELNKKTTCILSVSDSLVKEGQLSPEERQKSLTNMIILGLETAINI